jgi:hypothetical protein
MIRVEIIANHSVEENILEAFSREGVGKHYTKYPNVFGVGSSGPRMGDAVWPEENFSLIIWCEEDEAQVIARAVGEVKKQFPDEGIRIFGVPGEPNRFPHVAEPVWVHAGPVSPRAHPQAPQGGASAPQAVPPPAAQTVTAPPATPPPAAPQPPAQPVQADPARQAPGAPASPALRADPPPQEAAPETAGPPSPGSGDDPDLLIGKEYDGQNMET